ncbi:hypothetical protein [Vibrio lentus]|uniref:hypothetical protein n=1 Tax=Vibrio lentus TaxID=136468 RepID=UPI00178CCA11|nr:hypothetical protein [Vibrio lentus]MDN3630561.1 hypothetical protein [Vibrio lentus]
MIQLIKNSDIEVNLSRITKQQKEENYQKLNSVILNIFLTEGWSKVTYDRISKITGLRKSTLQGYYPSNIDFLVALQGNLKDLMLKELDLSSKEALFRSWNTALSTTEFSFIIEMLISHCISNEPTPIANQAMENFHKLIAVALPHEDSSEIMVHIFGLAVIAPIRETLAETIC